MSTAYLTQCRDEIEARPVAVRDLLKARLFDHLAAPDARDIDHRDPQRLIQGLEEDLDDDRADGQAKRRRRADAPLTASSAWRPIAGPVTHASRQRTHQLRHDLERDARALRARLWPAWQPRTTDEGWALIGRWVDPPSGTAHDASVILGLDTDGDVSRLRDAPQAVRRFVRNYWRYSGGLWRLADLLLYLLCDRPVPPEVLPAITARPVSSGVHPLAGGRLLEHAPYLVYEVTQIAPAATQRDLWTLWRAIHPTRARPGRPRDDASAALLTEIMRDRREPIDWVDVARAFNTAQRRRVSPETRARQADALRKRWARRRP